MRERNWSRRYWWHLPRAERRRLRGMTPEAYSAEVLMWVDQVISAHARRMTAFVAEAFRRAAEREAKP